MPLFDLGHRAKARQSAAEALRATVEAEQAQQQNDIQIAELTGSLRELDTLAEIASLKQQIADEQFKSVLAQLELGNGASSGPGSAAAAYPQRPSSWPASTSARSLRTRWTPDLDLARPGSTCCAPWATWKTGCTNCTESSPETG